MRVLVVDSLSGRTTIAVDNKDVVDVANILESSTSVKSFYVDGLYCKDQQMAFGAGDFRKWKSPIQ
jgi:hypothetical protein